MEISEIKNVLLPPIELHTGCKIIKADQTGDRPDGAHTTYKVTLPYGKDTGRPDVLYVDTGDNLELRQLENFRATISFTSYDFNDTISMKLAQDIHDWFTFYGQDVLSANKVAIIEITSVTNRDGILLEEYERRNGFDVIIRLSRELSRNVDYFDKIKQGDE